MMTNGGGSGNDVGGRVLDQLVDGLVGQTKQKEAALIKMGRDQAVNEGNEELSMEMEKLVDTVNLVPIRRISVLLLLLLGDYISSKVKRENC